jgi:hypothetical protein
MVNKEFEISWKEVAMVSFRQCVDIFVAEPQAFSLSAATKMSTPA